MCFTSFLRNMVKEMSDTSAVEEAFEIIKENGVVLALIVRSSFYSQGIKFFTDKTSAEQLAYMNRPKGEIVEPHIHNDLRREVTGTQEIVFMKNGKQKVDIYSGDCKFVCSRILNKGDIILLAAGGHGFEMLEDTELYVIKQGPYTGTEQDKTRFKLP